MMFPPLVSTPYVFVSFLSSVVIDSASYVSISAVLGSPLASPPAYFSFFKLFFEDSASSASMVYGYDVGLTYSACFLGY